MALPRGVVGWYVVCDCGNSYSFAFALSGKDASRVRDFRNSAKNIKSECKNIMSLRLKMPHIYAFISLFSLNVKINSSVLP